MGEKMLNPSKVLLAFPVLWRGWECDGTAWVMERPDGTRYLRITNHGDDREGTRQFLERKLAEYETVTKLTQQAMDLLEQSPCNT